MPLPMAVMWSINFTDDNPYNNKMLYSWGLGIDFVTYYDMVLRFEYAFTRSAPTDFSSALACLYKRGTDSH